MDGLGYMHSVVSWEDIIFSGFVLQGAEKPFYRKFVFYILYCKKRCFGVSAFCSNNLSIEWYVAVPGEQS